MELRHIEIDHLHISKLNMRYGKTPPDLSDILPSIRKRGVLQPLIVRPEDGGYGVVAGRRRYFSVKTIKDESGVVAPRHAPFSNPATMPMLSRHRLSRTSRAAMPILSQNTKPSRASSRKAALSTASRRPSASRR